jgi:hypothetical protein
MFLTHPHLALRLKKGCNYPSTTFWAFMACSGVTLDMFHTHYI